MTHAPKRPGAELTPREREVLVLVGRGCSNKVVADKLHLSVATVSDYLKTIFVKLGVRSRVCAAVWACRQGWLD